MTNPAGERRPWPPPRRRRPSRPSSRFSPATAPRITGSGRRARRRGHVFSHRRPLRTLTATAHGRRAAGGNWDARSARTGCGASTRWHPVAAEREVEMKISAFHLMPHRSYRTTSRSVRSVWVTPPCGSSRRTRVAVLQLDARRAVFARARVRRRLHQRASQNATASCRAEHHGWVLAKATNGSNVAIVRWRDAADVHRHPRGEEYAMLDCISRRLVCRAASAARWT